MDASGEPQRSLGAASEQPQSGFRTASPGFTGTGVGGIISRGGIVNSGGGNISGGTNHGAQVAHSLLVLGMGQQPQSSLRAASEEPQSSLRGKMA